MSVMNAEGEKIVTNNGNRKGETKPKEKLKMNKFQEEHIKGNLNVYAPVEAYYQEWEHITDNNGDFVTARPKPETRRRADMPSLAEQWRNDWAKRRQRMEKRNVKSSSNR